jgi:hypothetical protein
MPVPELYRTFARDRSDSGIIFKILFILHF